MPDLLPLAVGAKLTLIWQVPPGGTPAEQPLPLAARLKDGPVTTTFEIMSMVVLLLCSVTDLTGAFPIVTLPKPSGFGEIVSLIGGGFGVAVEVGVAVAVEVAVAVTVAVAVAVSVAVAVAVGVTLLVAVAVPVAVAVAVTDAVAVAVGVKVRVVVAVGVFEAVAVAVVVAV